MEISAILGVFLVEIEGYIPFKTTFLQIKVVLFEKKRVFQSNNSVWLLKKKEKLFFFHLWAKITFYFICGKIV